MATTITGTTIDVGPNKLVANSAGNVGVGTASPSEKLTIQSGNINFMGGTNDAQYIKFGDTGDDDIGNIFYYHGNNNMVFTTNASEAMRIDAAGIVTKPLQPAFHAMSGVGITNTSTFPVTIVEFSSALLNTGGHYSTTNDRFTAPVAGVYKFSVGFMSNGPIANRFGFFKNGAIQGNVGYAIAAEYQRTSYELCITLAVNDYVDFRTNINAGTEGSVHADYRYFTGYLIG